MLNGKLNFNDAKSFCKDEGSVLAMPKTWDDVSDIKEFDRKYLEFKLLFEHSIHTRARPHRIWKETKQQLI